MMYEEVGLSMLGGVGSGINLIFTLPDQKQKEQHQQQENSDNDENYHFHTYS